MIAPELSEYTGYLVRRAQQLHAALWQREVSAEITSVQFGVLSLLERNPGIDQRTLGRLLQLDRSTIADLVLRLEGRGYLERVRDNTDRRRNMMTITAAGLEVLGDLRPHVDRVNELLVGDLGDGERAELNRLLTVVLDSRAATPVIGDDSI